MTYAGDRRQNWPTKASLAARQVVRALRATAASVDIASITEDPLADLTAELADFERDVSPPGRVCAILERRNTSA